MEYLRKKLKKKSTPVKKYKKNYFQTIEYILIVPMAHIWLYVTFMHMLMVLTFHLDDSSGSAKKTTETSKSQDHLHGCLMGCGFLILSCNAFLMFRTCCCFKRRTVRIIHAASHIVSIPVMIFGATTMAGFHFKDAFSPYNIGNLYTFHGWMGVLLIMLYIFQSIGGIVAFLVCPLKGNLETAEFRARFSAYHKFIGIAIFFIGIILCVTGCVTYQMYFDMPFGYSTSLNYSAKEVGDYDNWMRRGSALKLIICMLTLTFCTMMYALLKDEFRYRGRILLATDIDAVRGIDGV